MAFPYHFCRFLVRPDICFFTVSVKFPLAFCFFLCYNSQLSIEYGLIGNAHSPE